MVPRDPSQTDSAKGKNAFLARWNQGGGQEEVDLDLSDDEEEIQAGRESIKLREVSLGLKQKKGESSGSSSSRLSVTKLLKESFEASKTKDIMKDQRHKELLDLKRIQIENEIKFKESQMSSESLEGKVLNIFKKDSTEEDEFSQPMGMALDLTESLSDIINSVREFLGVDEEVVIEGALRCSRSGLVQIKQTRFLQLELNGEAKVSLKKTSSKTYVKFCSNNCKCA